MKETVGGYRDYTLLLMKNGEPVATMRWNPTFKEIVLQTFVCVKIDTLKEFNPYFNVNYFRMLRRRFQHSEFYKRNPKIKPVEFPFPENKNMEYPV